MYGREDKFKLMKTIVIYKLGPFIHKVTYSRFDMKPFIAILKPVKVEVDIMPLGDEQVIDLEPNAYWTFRFVRQFYNEYNELTMVYETDRV